MLATVAAEMAMAGESASRVVDLATRVLERAPAIRGTRSATTRS